MELDYVTAYAVFSLDRSENQSTKPDKHWGDCILAKHHSAWQTLCGRKLKYFAGKFISHIEVYVF